MERKLYKHNNTSEVAQPIAFLLYAHAGFTPSALVLPILSKTRGQEDKNAD